MEEKFVQKIHDKYNNNYKKVAHQKCVTVQLNDEFCFYGRLYKDGSPQYGEIIKKQLSCFDERTVIFYGLMKDRKMYSGHADRAPLGDNYYYSGGIRNGVPHTIWNGKLYLNDKIIYKGEWNYGVKQGQGIGFYGDSIYVGEYWNDLRSGYGILLTLDKEVIYEGQWYRDQIKQNDETEPCTGKRKR